MQRIPAVLCDLVRRYVVAPSLAPLVLSPTSASWLMVQERIEGKNRAPAAWEARAPPDVWDDAWYTACLAACHRKEIKLAVQIQRRTEDCFLSSDYPLLTDRGCCGIFYLHWRLNFLDVDEDIVPALKRAIVAKQSGLALFLIALLPKYRYTNAADAADADEDSAALLYTAIWHGCNKVVAKMIHSVVFAHVPTMMQAMAIACEIGNLPALVLLCEKLDKPLLPRLYQLAWGREFGTPWHIMQPPDSVEKGDKSVIALAIRHPRVLAWLRRHAPSDFPFVEALAAEVCLQDRGAALRVLRVRFGGAV